MKQILAKRQNNQVNRICWTDEHSKLKPGSLIRFKDESGFWTIDKVYENTSLEKSEIKRNWHVGGL